MIVTIGIINYCSFQKISGTPTGLVSAKIYTSCYFMSFYMFGLTTVFVQEYTCLTIPMLAHGMRFKSLEPSVTRVSQWESPVPVPSSSWQLQSVEHALRKLEPLREFPTSTGPTSGTATSRTSCLFNITGHARDS